MSFFVRLLTGYGLASATPSLLVSMTTLSSRYPARGVWGLVQDFVAFWAPAFLIFAIPFGIAVAIARHFNLANEAFYVVGGCVSAGLVALLLGPPVPEFDEPTRSFLDVIVLFCGVGALSGMVCAILVVGPQRKPSRERKS